MAKKSNKNIVGKVLLPILGVAAVYGGYKALKLGNSVSNLSFDFKGVKYRGIKSWVLKLDVIFNLVNPSKSEFTVNSVYLDLILPNGKVIGQIRQPNFEKKLASGVTELVLNSNSNLLSAGLDIASQVLSIFTGDLPDIRVKGNVRANNILLTIDELVKLKDESVSGLGSTGLRSVRVSYDNGAVITTSMAAHLTDDEILEYYKIGTLFNVGSYPKEEMSAVKKVEILR